ncbi:hypothetical protein [Salinibacter ruber]|jgi:hypothetical protein|uniref:hypothetical protein n=1 Tax=Salinibacter ruber TaxID=146919 RepID=UPI0020735A15|nr:hypothetical protein [Salinibacter ruber]
MEDSENSGCIGEIFGGVILFVIAVVLIWVVGTVLGALSTVGMVIITILLWYIMLDHV